MAEDSTRPPVLLHVEDHEANLQVLRMVLQRCRPGWRLLEARTVAEAAIASRQQRPDLVLVDMRLPDGTGVDAIQAVLGEHDPPGPTVVVLTADATPRVERETRRAGASACWAKPPALPDLLTLLDATAAEVRP